MNEFSNKMQDLAERGEVTGRAAAVAMHNNVRGALGTARPTRRGFSLIELLVVISIIALLAAMTIAALGPIAKQKRLNTAMAEMHEIETAIESYHAKYGVYPPGNPTNTSTAALYTPLYYELTGVSFTDPTKVTYQSADTTVPVASINNVFGTAGILNCTKGSGEETVAAQNFLPGLKPTEVKTVNENGSTVEMLATSVAGPDAAYLPLDNNPGVNVFRYMPPSPTNHNANSYDLWINLSIGGTNFSAGNTPAKLYLIANWQKSYTGGSTMP